MCSPEVEYIKIGKGCRELYIPTFIRTEVIEKVKKIEEEIQKIERRIEYPIYVKERGKYAKIVERKEWIGSRELKIIREYEFEDERRDIKEVYLAEVGWIEREYDGWLLPEIDREWVIKDMKLIKSANYTEEVVDINALKSELEEKVKLAKKLLREELERLGFRFSVRDNGWRMFITITYNGEENTAIYNPRACEFDGLIGKYSLLASIVV